MAHRACRFVHLAFVVAGAAFTTAERPMMAMIIAIGRIAALVSLRLSDYDPSRLLKMQLKWHWLRVGVVYEFKALPTLPFGSLLSFKRLLRSTWAT